jgi:hypothetical protein
MAPPLEPLSIPLGNAFRLSPLEAQSSFFVAQLPLRQLSFRCWFRASFAPESTLDSWGKQSVPPIFKCREELRKLAKI